MADTKLLELPYERIAMAGGEMPDGLGSTDQGMFLALRCLYHSYKTGIINRETATKEKNKLLTEYQADILLDVVVKQWADQMKNTEDARQKYRKNRTLENADALILAFEGVPITFKEEAL